MAQSPQVQVADIRQHPLADGRHGMFRTLGPVAEV